MENSVSEIVLVGAGNVATHLGRELYKAGFNIRQIYSRTEESAKSLAYSIGCGFTTDIQNIDKNADLYIVSLKDSVLEDILPKLVRCNDRALFVHTAGSISSDIWKGLTNRYGVLYPMQTFSKQREVDFGKVHFFIEANSKSDTELLRYVSSCISPNVYDATSEQRKYLHISAVFACNFTNHMYAICQQILERHGLPFSSMLPLIDETAQKVHHILPAEAQTGPAIRNDINVMQKHLDMLKDEDRIADIYRIISKSIQEYDTNKKE